jgi:hypothetical protein
MQLLAIWHLNCARLTQLSRLGVAAPVAPDCIEYVLENPGYRSQANQSRLPYH